MKKKLNCVLLIDDDDVTNFINRKVIEQSAVAERIEVKLNGQEALDFLSQTSLYPSLILLDINMPVMDGWEFLEAYKKGVNEKTNIIMLSTSSNPDDIQRANSLPLVAAFKSKPLTFEMIEDIINTHFKEYI